VLAKLKIESFSSFNQKIYHASQQYLRLRSGKKRMSEMECRGLAEDAALQHALSYPDERIEPLVIAAILAMADSEHSEAGRAEIIRDAWAAYDDDKNWRTLH